MMARIDGVRITLFLPANNSTEALAANAVISGVLEQFGGVTHSELREPIFTGYWHDGVTRRTYRDRISLVIVDVQQALASEGLAQKLDELRGLVSGAYADEGVPQLDVWVVASAILLATE